MPLEPARGWEKDVGREFDKDRGKERNKDRERDRGPKDLDHSSHHSSRDRDRGNTSNIRRGNSGSSRAGGRRGDRPNGGAFHGAGNTSSNNSFSVNGDRTLAERMGLWVVWFPLPPATLCIPFFLLLLRSLCLFQSHAVFFLPFLYSDGILWADSRTQNDVFLPMPQSILCSTMYIHPVWLHLVDDL